MADSSCYTEYIALHEAFYETAFLCELLDSLGFLSEESTPLHCGNDATSCLTEDQTGHPSIKHIWVKFHSIWKLIKKKLIRITSI
jgi:hypothetical protein